MATPPAVAAICAISPGPCGAGAPTAVGGAATGAGARCCVCCGGRAGDVLIGGGELDRIPIDREGEGDERPLRGITSSDNN